MAIHNKSRSDCEKLLKWNYWTLDVFLWIYRKLIIAVYMIAKFKAYRLGKNTLKSPLVCFCMRKTARFYFQQINGNNFFETWNFGFRLPFISHFLKILVFLRLVFASFPDENNFLRSSFRKNTALNTSYIIF